jgi:hemerythrin superfamily protein
MPIQIGAKTHSFADPTGLLSDCHRRIKMFLGTLEAVAKTIDEPPSENTRQALLGSLRYFAEAAPKHTADEEESLFPRLRQIKDAEIQSAFKSMDNLEDDHRSAECLCLVVIQAVG